MTNKKNRFFTLVFSCFPGAGEMYLGLYRQGISLMVAFFGILAVIGWVRLFAPLGLFCPVIWCYSFFHTHNLRRMTEEEFAAVEDRYYFTEYLGCEKDFRLTQRNRRLLGIVLILAAVSCLWERAVDLAAMVFPRMDYWYWSVAYGLPQIVVALAVLIAAVWLMKGTAGKTDKEEMPPMEAEEMPQMQEKEEQEGV